MSDLKLYEVNCSVSFYIEVEAESEYSAKELIAEHLEDRGIYDLTDSTSRIQFDNIVEVKE